MNSRWIFHTAVVFGLLLALSPLVILFYPIAVLAQPGCVTVFLPDLAPAEGIDADHIATGFAVPPGWTQPAGAFYPVNLHSNLAGQVYLEQAVGHAWARQRYFDRIGSISLVWWTSVFDPWFTNWITLQGYKTLRNTAPPGVVPTWAYRRMPYINTPVANENLSMPVQLGEDWNFSVRNDLDYTVWIDQAQVEARLCP